MRIVIIIIMISVLFEDLISRSAENASQRQIYIAILCFRADPLSSSPMRDCNLHSAFLNGLISGVLTTLFGCYMAGATENNITRDSATKT